MKKIILFAFALMGFIMSCKKDADPDSVMPVEDSLIKIRTMTVDEHVLRRALVGGDVSDDGGEDIFERGVCWSAQGYPTTGDSVARSGKGTGTFKIYINNLISEQRYFLRAYAKNKYGTVYGNRVSFVVDILPPTIAFKENNLLTSNSIEATLFIQSDGGSPVIEKGVYCDTFPFISTTGIKVPVTSTTDTFKVSVTGLRESTKYYFTSYARNKAGNTLWLVHNFITADLQAPSVITLQPTTITRTSITIGGTINAPAGNTILERGIRYSASNPVPPSPFDPQTSEGSGAGTFSSNLTGLQSNRAYYIRAFARTPAGVFYGPTVVVTTLP